MATIDRYTQLARVDSAERLVQQTHRAVCAARSSRSHHRRHPCVHHSRRTRRRQVSRYRALTRVEIPTLVSPSGSSRRASRHLERGLAITMVLALACLVLLQVFVPSAHSRPVLLVVGLMAIVGAVVLNAFTIDSTGRLGSTRPEPPGEPSGPLAVRMRP